MAAKNVLHQGAIELEKQKKIVADIRALCGDDDAELLSDSIEGETMLFELVDNLIAVHEGDKALVAGIKLRISDLDARKQRMEKRCLKIKALIQSAVDMSGLPKMELASATVSLKTTPAGYEITEEDEVPTQYFSTPDPVIDRAKIKEFWKKHNDDLKAAKALKDLDARQAAIDAIMKAHEPIPGTAATPEGQTIALRTK